MSEEERSSITNRFSAGKIWLLLIAKDTQFRYLVPIFFLIIVCIGAFFSTRFLDYYVPQIAGTGTGTGAYWAMKSDTGSQSSEKPRKALNETITGTSEFPLNCSLGKETQVCLGNYYPSKFYPRNPAPPPSTTCPDYFRWIHDDLWPWRETGITEDMVRRAGATANFRLVIVNGTAYLETYDRPYQTRDRFTLYGILQLLRRYPGQVPDLDLMFDCDDLPVVKKEFHSAPGSPAPPPVFHYCKDDATLDIVFPDWSFWGWPEINIKPWGSLSEELKAGNERSKWVDREPYAYWKGNPDVAETRKDLLKCNVSDQEDWGARIYIQDWIKEQEQGYNQSDLAKQCIHRYKIYIEGSGWSVSEKYILACNSLALFVKPRFYDFFTRSLMPLQHYWPIKDDDKCRSIRHAVDWGNKNQDKAEKIRKAGSKFVEEKLRMENVYEYMFHLLREYAKLLTYKPSIPPKAIELCSESMACPAMELEKKFMREAFVAGPTTEAPCAMPPPYDPATLHSLVEEKQNSTKLVDEWEKQYWDKWQSN